MFNHRVTIHNYAYAGFIAGFSLHYSKKSNFDYLHISLKALNSVQQTAQKIKIIFAYDNCYILYLLSSMHDFLSTSCQRTSGERVLYIKISLTIPYGTIFNVC